MLLQIKLFKLFVKIIGTFSQAPNTHLSGSGCFKCGCIKRKLSRTLDQNKIIEDFKKVHNNRYDYSLVNYTHGEIHLKIICKLHGEFPCSANNHKKGHGCPKCAKENILYGLSSFKFKEWVIKANKSKNFHSFKIYVIKCFDNNGEEFIKIGKTYREVKDRFVGNFPYNYEIIKEIIFEDGLECCNYEVELHNKFTDHSYSPSKKFGGSTECFSIEILNKL